MTIKLATSCFIFAALLAPVAAQAEDQDADRTHPVAFVKNAVITIKIKANLADAKMSSLLHIGVDTDRKGAVVLKGKLRTQEEADKAVAIARTTEGVISVESHIKVREDD